MGSERLTPVFDPQEDHMVLFVFGLVVGVVIGAGGIIAWSFSQNDG